VAGTFLTWTSDGPVHLDGIDGPNNGWLVVIVSAFAIGWTRAMARGSWFGVAGVLGSAGVIAWTAAATWLDSRAVFGATASFGLFLVLAASVALAASAVLHAVGLRRDVGAPPDRDATAGLARPR
jgi:hypothetical protein